MIKAHRNGKGEGRGEEIQSERERVQLGAPAHCDDIVKSLPEYLVGVLTSATLSGPN